MIIFWEGFLIASRDVRDDDQAWFAFINALIRERHHVSS